MQTTLFNNWMDFVHVCLEESPASESPIVYRGQTDAHWPIQATLDRARGFANDEERARYQTQLLDDFRREATGLEHFAQQESPKGESLELLARHHGLPSMILDWTRSPFVAAFFAFDGVLDRPNLDRVAVYALPLVWLPEKEFGNDIDLIDNPELLWTNVRAVEQHSVFMRVKTREPIDQKLGGSILKAEFPASEARLALRSLSKMGIDARSLFRDLDGAARSVRNRHRIMANSGEWR